jgi:hypothetical protein
MHELQDESSFHLPTRRWVAANEPPEMVERAEAYLRFAPRGKDVPENLGTLPGDGMIQRV